MHKVHSSSSPAQLCRVKQYTRENLERNPVCMLFANANMLHLRAAGPNRWVWISPHFYSRPRQSAQVSIIGGGIPLCGNYSPYTMRIYRGH